MFMNKKSLLLVLAASCLLVSCGDADQENKGDNGGDNDSSSLPYVDPNPDSGDIVTGDAGFKLVMFGDLYLHQMRSIYAVLDDGVIGSVTFSSDNEDIIVCSPDENRLNQALLRANGLGTATISAYIEGQEDKVLTKTITVSSGTALPEETFNKLTGAMKVNLTESRYDYDEKLSPTLYDSYNVTTIYEENEDIASYPYHNTDAYQINSVNIQTGVSDYSRLFVRNGTRLATEYISSDNTIVKQTQYDDEGEEYDWVNSAYENPFKYDEESDEAPNVVATDFETFDGGKTYHYVGEGIYSTFYIAKSFTLRNNFPDDFVITVNGDDIGFQIFTDPASALGEDEMGGTTISGKFSEIGTAKVTHLEPYKHESYHDAIESARSKMASARNYTASYSFSDSDGTMTYTHVFTEDTIDEKIVQADGTISHTGVHKTDTGYFTYEYDDSTGVLTKTKDYTADFSSVNRYPTFDFAVEILGQGSKDGEYISRGNETRFFYSYCWYLPRFLNYYTVSDDVAVTLKDGYFASMSTELASNVDSTEEPASFVGKYSNFGTSAVSYDWDNIVLPTEPTNYPTELLASLKQFGVDEVIPYLYPTNVGYADNKATCIKDKSNDGYASYCYFETNKFETDELRDAYIASYKELLVNNGWTLTTEVDDHLGYDYYISNDGNWKLSVGAYKAFSTGAAWKNVVFTFNSATGQIAIPDGYHS